MKFLAYLIINFIIWTNAYTQGFRTNDLASSSIEPAGWVKEFLNRQESGLTGNPEQSGFPFNTKMWADKMNFKDREFKGGSAWWPYEQTAYYLDGALRCAYLNNSDTLKQKVLTNINYVLKQVDNEGVLHAGNVDDDWWPLVVFMRMLFEQYKNTQDSTLLQTIETHYQTVYKKQESFNLPKHTGFAIRSVLHVEHLANLYGITGKDWYLQVAEKLYSTFEDNLNTNSKEFSMLTATGMAQGVKPSGHAVTYHEFLKLPAILYYYTNKEKYKIALYKAYDQLEKHHELADGLPSGIEELHGNHSDMAHEVCNVSDFNWSAGWALLATGNPKFADKMEKVIYNAGFSSITPDFKAHQYYSAPNMPLSTDMSSFYNDETNWGFNAKGRLCYRPGHDTECCTGNIHRMFPTFLNRAIVSHRKGANVVFYLPGTYTIPIGTETLKIKQKTNYPFEHSISLEVINAPKKKLELGLRIPDWADSYQITINDNTPIKGADKNRFKIITRKFTSGDSVILSFKTAPRIYKKNGIAINYGPLVFSYSVEAHTKITTKDAAGKCSNEFPAYQMFPKKHLSYGVAFPKAITSDDIKLIQNKIEGYPWDIGNSPIKIKLKARSVLNWKLKEQLYVSKIPKEVKLTEEAEKEITLEPMGTTYLRITEFPSYN